MALPGFHGFTLLTEAAPHAGTGIDNIDIDKTTGLTPPTHLSIDTTGSHELEGARPARRPVTCVQG